MLIQIKRDTASGKETIIGLRTDGRFVVERYYDDGIRTIRTAEEQGATFYIDSKPVSAEFVRGVLDEWFTRKYAVFLLPSEHVIHDGLKGAEESAARQAMDNPGGEYVVACLVSNTSVPAVPVVRRY